MESLQYSAIDEDDDFVPRTEMLEEIAPDLEINYFEFYGTDFEEEHGVDVGEEQADNPDSTGYDSLIDADILRQDIEAEQTAMTKLGPEIKLDDTQHAAAMLMYLDLKAGEDGWYRPKQTDQNKPNHKSQGINLQLSAGTGFASGRVNKTVNQLAEDGWVEVETMPGKRGTIMMNARLTEQGLKVLKKPTAAQQASLKIARDYLTYALRRDIIALRREVTHERRIIRQKWPEEEFPLFDFEDLTKLTNLAAMEKHRLDLFVIQGFQVSAQGELTKPD